MLSLSNFPSILDTMREFDRAFDFGRDALSGGLTARPLMRYDLVQKDKEYQISIDLPGVKPEDVKIELEGNRLTIEAERHQEELQEGERLITSRSAHGKFMQTFSVGEEVNPEMIDAQFANGVLKLTLPRQEQLKSRQIPLNVTGKSENKKISAQKH